VFLTIATTFLVGQEFMKMKERNYSANKTDKIPPKPDNEKDRLPQPTIKSQE
jgi:hypothetical protein